MQEPSRGEVRIRAACRRQPSAMGPGGRAPRASGLTPRAAPSTSTWWCSMTRLSAARQGPSLFRLRHQLSDRSRSCGDRGRRGYHGSDQPYRWMRNRGHVSGHWRGQHRYRPAVPRTTCVEIVLDVHGASAELALIVINLDAGASETETSAAAARAASSIAQQAPALILKQDPHLGQAKRPQQDTVRGRQNHGEGR